MRAARSAIAGVMGGATSEVSGVTTDVVVESAVFDPVSIRRTAFHFALRSEASLRFEKGQESRLARVGADRVAELIVAWAGGSAAAGRVDIGAGRAAAGTSRVPTGTGQPAPRHVAQRGRAGGPARASRHRLRAGRNRGDDRRRWRGDAARRAGR